ncbi:MAG: hypothetical protein ACRC41_14810 [Sarcina sp.]
MYKRKILFFLTIIISSGILGCEKNSENEQIKANSSSLMLETNLDEHNNKMQMRVPRIVEKENNLNVFKLDFSGIKISNKNNVLSFEKNLDLMNEAKKIHKMNNDEFEYYSKSVDDTMDILNNHLNEEEMESLLTIYNEHIANNSNLVIVELAKSNAESRLGVDNLSISLSIGIQNDDNIWVQQNSNFSDKPAFSLEDDAVGLMWNSDNLVGYDSNPKLSIKWSDGTYTTESYSTFDGQNITSTKFDEDIENKWAKEISYGIALKNKKQGITSISSSYAQPQNNRFIKKITFDQSSNMILWE